MTDQENLRAWCMGVSALRVKLQIPSFNHQRNFKHPNTKEASTSVFKAWSFSGAWMLVLGTLPMQAVPFPLVLAVWCLVLLWMLDVGAWCFFL